MTRGLGNPTSYTSAGADLAVPARLTRAGPATPQSAELLALYHQMLLLREFDERCVAFHSQGRLGTFAIAWGHEAIQVGAVAAASSDDWLFPSYREAAIGLLRGMPPTTVLSWWCGRPEGWWDPYEFRVASIAVPIASHIPHAAGLAWGLKLRGAPGASIVFFGDGATSEGAFHEGINFAAVNEVPLVLVCNNNALAISTPLDRQTRAESLAEKARGYGIPGLRVDGTDVLAVRDAVASALERAREGSGPTFIEAVSYRARPHATADNPALYVDRSRQADAERGECLRRFGLYLADHGILTSDIADGARREIRTAVTQAMEEVERMSPAPLGEIFDHVYAEAPESLLTDRLEAEEYWDVDPR